MTRRWQTPTDPDAKARAAQARQDKVTALHRQLDEQVAALRSGQDWQRWLRVATQFHSYSFNNVLLILAQRPDATQVAGYGAWQQLGRQVAKGETGIRILAPIIRRVTDESSHTAKSDDTSRSGTYVAGYRLAYVWDITQTTGDPLPDQPAPQLLRGAAPDGLWDALAAAVTGEGYQLRRGPCGRANGHTAFTAHTVTVRPDLAAAQAVKTLAHELAHVRLHVPADSPSARPMVCRGLAEVEAESVAYVVTAAHGLDTGTYTFPYVAGWAQDVICDPADAVRVTGQRVVTTAHWILDRTQQPDPADIQLAERAKTAARRTAALRERVTQRPATRAASRARGGGREQLLELHDAAARFYATQVSGSWVPGYLDGRSLALALGPPWNAGYAPRGWTALTDHLRGLGATDDALLDAGLAVHARTGHLIDRFRDRLVLPLHDKDSDVIAFIGRAHPEAGTGREPKYLNSPQTPIYRKGEHLYGLAEAAGPLRRGARAALVEGPLDAVAVTTGTRSRCVGIAAYGTALTTEHVRLLTTSDDITRTRIVVATDADPAGRAAAQRALALLTRAGVDPTAAALPAGSDPAELLHQAGPEALTAALLDQARPLADQVIDQRLDRWANQLHWVEGRVGAVRDAAQIVATLPPAQIARQIGRIAACVDVDRAIIQHEIDILTPRAEASWTPQARSPAITPVAPSPPALAPSRRSR